MSYINQIQKFHINTIFWRFLGVWPKDTKFYKWYMAFFVFTFCIFYDLLFTINFYFIPRELDIYIGDMLFYFTELSVASKALTFCFKTKQIKYIFQTLESEDFQPENDEEYKIIENANTFNRRYYYVILVVSLISHLTHIFTPLILHAFLSVPLELPICSYSFISDETIKTYIYPLYIYQIVGMHSHVWYNINIDTFFLGIIKLAIAQLEILDGRLRKITAHVSGNTIQTVSKEDKERHLLVKLNMAIKQFDNISRFISLIESAFSITLFVQISMASAIICICVFRFTLPAPISYLIFLSTYMFIMTVQVFVPCWYGTQIIYKSDLLSRSVYDCDWMSRSRKFKSNMKIFVERTKRPLTIFGWKMFPLSLKTFTSIINTAYSFFTLLRHMQSRQ